MSSTICQLWEDTLQKWPHKEAVIYKDGSKWRHLTWTQVYEEITYVAGFLKSQNVQQGDKVAILAQTSYAWYIVDQAILGLGAVTIPIYPSHTADEIQYVLNHSQAIGLWVENTFQHEKWLRVAQNCAYIRFTSLMTEPQKQANPHLPKDPLHSWRKVFDEGKRYKEHEPRFFLDTCRETKLSDIATIVYTSGTTGQPKGAVITHASVKSVVEDVFPTVGMGENDRTLTFLPFSHILGRVEAWGAHVCGYSLGFAESIERLRSNFGDIRPTVFVAVPRVFEKLYEAIRTQAELNHIQRKVFEWAVEVGKKVNENRSGRHPLSISLLAQYRLANRMVFNKIKSNLGGRLRFVVSGGAPLNSTISEFFHAAGVMILEGYGLTETCGPIVGNSPFDCQLGTVGKPFGDVEVRLAEDGEVLIRSKKVMKGYYKAPESTHQVLRDGWFRTGDIGNLTDDGYLQITERKKDLIKTSGGKYIAPQRIENLFKGQRYISNILVHGERRKYVSALITLNRSAILEFAQQNDISYNNYQELTQSPEVNELIRTIVSRANHELASYETIKRFQILDHDFTVEGGELTPSLKVKRKHCDKKYREMLDQLYL